jgi:hypothetical protein
MIWKLIATIQKTNEASMGTEATISERQISGTGIIRVPLPDAEYRVYTLFADIIRRPTTEYRSFEHEPPQGFYARMSFTKNGYVVDTTEMRYEAQKWVFIPDITGHNLIAIKCMYLGLLQTFTNLGSALNLLPYTVDNTIVDYTTIGIPWDEIRIKCYKDCAIQFVLKAVSYDMCNPNYGVPQLEPDYPEKPTTVPPGTPIEISDPYDDDPTTEPNPLDNGFTPVGIPGVWTLTWTDRNGGTPSGQFPGLSTDVFELQAGVSTTCTLSGRSQLVRNGSEIVDGAFNCNPFGFVSTLVSQVFLPN